MKKIETDKNITAAIIITVFLHFLFGLEKCDAQRPVTGGELGRFDTVLANKWYPLGTAPYTRPVAGSEKWWYRDSSGSLYIIVSEGSDYHVLSIGTETNPKTQRWLTLLLFMPAFLAIGFVVGRYVFPHKPLPRSRYRPGEYQRQPIGQMCHEPK